jgi:hypothetical protein
MIITTKNHKEMENLVVNQKARKGDIFVVGCWTIWE